MPTFKKGHRYVYLSKGKPTSHVIIPIEDREVSHEIYINWKEIKIDPDKNKIDLT